MTSQSPDPSALSAEELDALEEIRARSETDLLDDEDGRHLLGIVLRIAAARNQARTPVSDGAEISRLPGFDRLRSIVRKHCYAGIYIDTGKAIAGIDEAASAIASEALAGSDPEDLSRSASGETGVES
jgi:hypothetical protein